MENEFNLFICENEKWPKFKQWYIVSYDKVSINENDLIIGIVK